MQRDVLNGDYFSCGNTRVILSIFENRPALKAHQSLLANSAQLGQRLCVKKMLGTCFDDGGIQDAVIRRVEYAVPSYRVLAGLSSAIPAVSAGPGASQWSTVVQMVNVDAELQAAVDARSAHKGDPIVVVLLNSAKLNDGKVCPRARFSILAVKSRPPN